MFLFLFNKTSQLVTLQINLMLCFCAMPLSWQARAAMIGPHHYKSGASGDPGDRMLLLADERAYMHTHESLPCSAVVHDDSQVVTMTV